MTPAALFCAVSLALPGPYELSRADALIRFPDLVATDLTERDRLAIVAAAIRLELFSPDAFTVFDFEAGYYSDDPAAVLELARTFFAEVAGAPPLAAAARLPVTSACHAAAEFNRQFARRLRDRLAWEPHWRDALEPAVATADLYAEFWSLAAWAGEPVYPPADRRQALAQLREMLGRAAWDRGDLPDFAPTHLFREAR